MCQDYINNGNFTNHTRLLNALRKLWEQHVMWTRSFIISTLSNLDDLEYVTERLLRNPTDFAIVLGIFYGEDKARKFQDLLREHLLIAANLVNAVKTNDTVVINDARTKWYENADEIAAFLSFINPYWNQAMWRDMLYDHLKMIENGVMYRLTKDYSKDIENYDMIETQALQMADLMWEGIMNQLQI